MVSENRFNEVVTSNIERDTVEEKMAQVDISMPQSSKIVSIRNELPTDEPAELDDRKDDQDSANSDIELVIEDSDDTTPAKKVATQNSSNIEKTSNSTSVPVKDIESVESLDNDLTNTANLVKKRFSLDDFDNADSLDSINDELNKSSLNDINEKNNVNLTNQVPSSNNLTNQSKPNDDDDTEAQVSNKSPVSSELSDSQIAIRLKRVNSANKNLTENPLENSLLVESNVESREQNENPPIDTKLHESTSSLDNHDDRVSAVTSPNEVIAENLDQNVPHESNHKAEETEIKNNEQIETKSPTNEIASNEPLQVNAIVEQSTIPEVSTVHFKDTETSEAETLQKVSENVNKLKEDVTDNECNSTSLDDDEIVSTVGESFNPSISKVDLSGDNDTVSSSQSPIPNTVSSSHDVQCEGPRSVESTEIQIIDLADQEVVDLIDDANVPEKSVNSKISAQPVIGGNDCFTVDSSDEVTNQDVMEVILDNGPSTSTPVDKATNVYDGSVTTETEIPLNRRKRKHESLETGENLEKRSRSVDHSKATNKENISNGNEIKKKSGNIARKHTSAVNVAKTVEEIEKKIHNNIIERKRSRSRSNSREPTPTSEYDEYDRGVNLANDIEIEHEETPRRDGHKIKLNMDVISKENLKSIFSVMRTKLTRRQLEEIVIQKCCEMISDSGEIGELKRQVADLQQAEFYRKQKIMNLEKQIHQLKAVCQRYLEQVKEFKGGVPPMPIKITRSVGLQVAIDSTPTVQLESHTSNQRNEERLKKLLTTPTTNRKTITENRRETSSPRHTVSSSTSLSNGRNVERPGSSYGDTNSRIGSPMNSNATPTSSLVRNNANLKKTAKPTEDTVIDLTDKDDKIENEAHVAANNLIASVNDPILTYVPIKINQDQNRQGLKPGTQVLVNGQLMTVQSKAYSRNNATNQHPAPVPNTPVPRIIQTGLKPLPPQPILRIAKNGSGIMLSWYMPIVPYAEVRKYQLYAYQETNAPPSSDLWKVVGDVDALPLPMACTLTQFVEGYRYHFIVRALDVHGRIGPFSSPESIIL